jgi:hypothetical protein
MIYMDCVQGLNNLDDFYQTLAHEFQHMINYNQKVFVQNAIEQDTWINEGLSSAAETIYSGAIIENKRAYYDTDPDGKISSGMNFLTWRDGEYTNYATVYLFFQWLRIQSSLGDRVFKEIINTNDSDYQAVLKKAQTTITGYNLSTTWKTVLGDWFIANYFNSPSGIHGYVGQISFSAGPKIVTSNNFTLYPGDGVYKQISSAINASASSTIEYNGLNKTGYLIDSSGTLYTGNVLLCFNYDGNSDNPPTSIALSYGSLPVAQRSSVVYSPSITVSDQNKYPMDRVNMPTRIKGE